MFYEFLRFLGYIALDILPLGAESHTILINYYFNYSSITNEIRILCLSSMGLGLFLYFIFDYYKIFKEFFKGLRLILIGRGTIKQVCTELRLLNMMISIIGVVIACYLSYEFLPDLSNNMYLVGAMLIVSGLTLRIPETFAHIKMDGRLFSYKEFFVFAFLQFLGALPGASRMAILMGGGKFLGIEKKHLIKFTFLSLTPVIFIRLAYTVPAFGDISSVIEHNLIWMGALTLLTMIVTSICVRVFSSVSFYKFYYYLIGIGAWTILDVLFGKRGL